MVYRNQKFRQPTRIYISKEVPFNFSSLHPRVRCNPHTQQTRSITYFIYYLLLIIIIVVVAIVLLFILHLNCRHWHAWKITNNNDHNAKNWINSGSSKPALFKLCNHSSQFSSHTRFLHPQTQVNILNLFSVKYLINSTVQTLISTYKSMGKYTTNY